MYLAEMMYTTIPLGSGESNEIPLLPTANQLRVHALAATVDIQHLGESHLGVIGEWDVSRDECYISSVQRRDGVVTNLDREHTLQNLECSSTCQSPGRRAILGLTAERNC